MSYLPLDSLTGETPADPITEEIEFKTLVSNFENQGLEQSQQKWLFPKRHLTIKYDGEQGLSVANGRLLWAFYIARKGRHEAFSVFILRTDTYVQEYVGTGDAATLIFNLPSKGATSYSVYFDNEIQSSGYTFTSLGGPDGEDKITFASPPPDGTYITFSFTGQLKVRSKFMEDKLSFDDFYRRIINIGIKTRGQLNA